MSALESSNMESNNHTLKTFEGFTAIADRLRDQIFPIGSNSSPVVDLFSNSNMSFEQIVQHQIVNIEDSLRIGSVAYNSNSASMDVEFLK